VRVENRAGVIDGLRTAGIGVGIHYPTAVPRSAAYARLGYRPGQFPIAEAAARRILSLPMYPHLTEVQQAAVRDALAAVVDGGSE